MTKPKRPIYLGEHTGENTALTPEQLLILVQEALTESPAKGMYVVLLRDGKDGALDLDTFRCGLPLFVEIVMLARQYHTTLGRA